MNRQQQTIAELVSEDYRRATVFKKHGIDFCCGGGNTLESVCNKRGLSIDEVERELADAEQSGTASLRVSHWQPDFLVDFIVNEHHGYVAESIPLLLEFTRKVARVHGEENPSLIQIAELFESIASELSQHMAIEERILFPGIKALVRQDSSDGTTRFPGARTIPIQIRKMIDDHEHAGDTMKAIRELSNNYTPPAHACNTYRVSFAKLEEFEDNLHRHVHLENNILFPKARELAGAEIES
ncbi:MAG: iron-sulfur cluster repair di-iron protein [Bacteroidetes bacterium]|nr:iron-sulfur cluster repair di-iron protein [Bacteroidota bacterium]